MSTETAKTPMINWARYRPTRLRVFGVCLTLFTIIIVVSFAQFSQAKNNVLPAGTPIGGDYVAFFSAAHAVKEGRAAEMYDVPTFQDQLRELGPPLKSYGLYWQYPPTFYLIIAPLAFLPFVAGYIAWTGCSAACFILMLRSAGFDKLFLFAVLAAPSTFHAVITGQNGFITATLLTLAALYPDKRPIVAGLAAAALTFKPQLGLLLPIAFMFGGHWRAFFIAASGTLAFASFSTAAFGPEIWQAFLSSTDGTSDRLNTGILPIAKMVTPFAWLRFIGTPTMLALSLQLLFSFASIAIVAITYLRVKEADLRAAVLCAAVFFLVPYGYFYELVILVFPVGILARYGLTRGWLRYEQALIALIFMAPMMAPGFGRTYGMSFGFPCMALVGLCVLRRLLHEYPSLFQLPAPFSTSQAPA